jgi:hypothetical protein
MCSVQSIEGLTLEISLAIILLRSFYLSTDERHLEVVEMRFLRQGTGYTACDSEKSDKMRLRQGIRKPEL